ncbi:MAG: hypothetical protein IJ903_03615 [Ruminococcus sp.]|nr:hypothetical protein [Ruminococcus sp.]
MEKNKENRDKKQVMKERTIVEFLNDIVDKAQRFTDDKLDKLEDKLNKYTID